MSADRQELDGRTAWIVATATVAILTISYGAPLIAVVSMKTIAAELQTPRSDAAAAGALVYLGAAVGGILAGWLAGKFGIRPIVIFGAVMMGAGLALAGTGGLPELYAGHGILMGFFGSAFMFTPMMTYVSRWFERRRGAAIALISSGQSVAGAIWPSLITISVDHLGWRRTMLFYGILLTISIVALAVLFLHPPPVVPATAHGMTQAGGRSDKVLGLSPNLVMILLSIAILCCCIPMAVPINHVVAYCGDLGYSAQYGAAMLSLLLGSAFLARQFWGWLCDRVGGLQTLVWASLGQMTALLAFTLIQDGTVMFFIAAAFGFGQAGLVPAYVIVVRRHYSVQESNWRMPVVLFGGTLGMAVGGWGAGLIFDWTSSYVPAFAAAVGINAINFAIVFFLLGRDRGLGGYTKLMRQPQIST
ncbi:MAG: MFS transporter [Proteobacteria bacterium]|nr:MFS transporter [Pseudomonadota bacterium]